MRNDSQINKQENISTKPKDGRKTTTTDQVKLSFKKSNCRTWLANMKATGGCIPLQGVFNFHAWTVTCLSNC